MKTKILYFMLGAGLLFTQSCTKYPPSSERLLQDLAVITQYDTKANFSDYKTYSIPTKATKITSKDTTQIQNAATDAIFAQIEKNLIARGFTKSLVPGVSDVAIALVYFENTYVYTYYYDWWGYYPSYGYYYPYYPVYYSSYTAGLADIQLIDLKNVNPDKKEFYIRWDAYIRGLLTGSHTTPEITGAVDQAFTQTPQLVTTKAN